MEGDLRRALEGKKRGGLARLFWKAVPSESGSKGDVRLSKAAAQCQIGGW